jgi:hypothetical protein
MAMSVRLSRRWSGDFSKTRFSGLRELDDQPQDPVEFKRSAMASHIRLFIC